MAVRTVAHPTVDDRRGQGKTARDQTAPSSHAGWAPASGRSITDFSQRYADQNEQDHQTFADAIASGWLASLQGV
jgi:hypothetical protein